MRVAILADTHGNLLALEAVLADDHILACHGSPAGGDLDYLLDDVTSGRAVLASEEAIRPRSQTLPEHRARFREGKAHSNCH